MSAPALKAGPVRPIAGVVARRLGDGGVLVNLRDNQIYEFNATGMSIWDMVCDGHTDDQMVQRLVSAFDVSPGRARQELNAHLELLEAQRLVDRCSP